jgi:anti-anti-sigma factor
MAMTTRTSRSATVVEPHGSCTAADGATEFRDTIRTLIDNGQTQVVVNCLELPFLDSAAIRESVQKCKLAQAHGGATKLALSERRCRPFCSGLFKLLAVFDTYDSEAEAIASFGGDRA